VSTFAGRLESASALHAETILDRRRTRYVIAIVGLVTGLGACVLVGTSDHLVDPLEYGLLLVDVIVGTAAVAVYWLVRRQEACWLRLEDAACELWSLHSVPENEIVARVRAMIERERSAPNPDLETS
jgi:hypothetical protein